MAENSKIEWTDHTVNLWWGCSKIHTGCKNCYAEVLSDVRYQKNLWGENAKRQRIKSAFNDLDKYQKQAAAENKLLKIFCGSMMDIFEESKELLNPTEDIVDSKYDIKSTSDLRRKLFQKICEGNYNNLVFLFLTKRPENIIHCIPFSWLFNAPKNVWFGTSISDQKTADDLIPKLLATGQSNLFLSLEPQVGEVSFRWAEWHNYKSAKNRSVVIPEGKYELSSGQYDGIKGIGWIIQGGESGHNKRPFNLEWAHSMKEDCEGAKIPYFFKQIDKIQPVPENLMVRQFPVFEPANP